MTLWWPTPSVPTDVRETTTMLLLEVDTPEEPQEHDRQFCEVLTTALKASLLHRDRREPRQLMTLTVRNDEEREEDSGLDEDEQPAEHQCPTETQIKMVNQYHRNLGHPSRARVSKSVEGNSRETCSARICPT